MFYNLFKMQTKKVIYSKEWLFSISIGLGLTLVCFIVDAAALKGAFIGEVYPASYMWSPYKGSLNIIYLPFIAFILPLLACNVCSTLIRDNSVSNRTQIMITRSGYVYYYLATALVIVLFSFLVTFIPLLINQLLWFIASPLYSFNRLNSDYIFSAYEDRLYMVYPSLHYNYPYLYNLLYMFLISLFGTVAAIISFSLSFIIKNKILIILFPTILVLLETAFTQFSFLLSYIFGYILMPSVLIQQIEMNFYYLVLLTSSLISVLIIIIKTRRKDIYD